MAKKPAAAAAHVEELPPEMDYKMHEATWKGFTNLTKWAIIALAVAVVLLYFIIRP